MNGSHPVVVVVGAGFSGLLTAIHLLRGRPDVHVRLIDQTGNFGPGRAYGLCRPEHLLNVRAFNMSAFPDEPHHFLDWLGERRTEAFVTRRQYGDYLRELLNATRSEGDKAWRLSLESSEVQDGRIEHGRWQLTLNDGRVVLADAVVLAVGFLPAALPAGIETRDLPDGALVLDPWSRDLAHLPGGPVLLLGTGLTMIDVVLSLATSGRSLTALSRRGLVPLRHGPGGPAEPPDGTLSTPRVALETLRRHAEAFGWRAAVDSVRPITADIWRSWSLPERRRFLRHLRPWWDIHRHRMAPSVADQIMRLQALRQLTIRAGRVEALRGRSGRIEAVIRHRGGDCRISALFSAVVNCAAPQGDPAHATKGLIGDLRRRGLLRSDPLGLGLDVDLAMRVLGDDGRPTKGLFAAGPLTRGASWEAVAVPDLRHQTAAVAGAVLEELKAEAASGVTASVSPLSSLSPAHPIPAD